MSTSTKYSINYEIPGFLTITTDDPLSRAMELKADFPRATRVISADKDLHATIDAAYESASGLSLGGVVIAENIYRLRKECLASFIAITDKSIKGLRRAAYEMAKAVYASGCLDEKAKVLADSCGKSQSECEALIAESLALMSKQLDARTYALSTAQLAAANTGLNAKQMLGRVTNSPGTYLIQAPTGFGKTIGIIEPLIAQSINEGKRVLIVTHRRSINASIATNIVGVVCYSNCTDPEVIEKARAIKVVVNSISAAKFRDFIANVDVVIIDEASQVVAHTLGGEVKDRQAVSETLDKAVRSAKTVVMTDADINTLCTDLAGSTYTLLTAERYHSDITIHTTSADTARALAIKSAQAGKKTLIACDLAKDAQAIAKMIGKASDAKPLVITAETARWPDQAAFIANPNNNLHSVVIYSPVITSALSITTTHFENHFGIFAGQVGPTDCIQMLRRDRTATSFIVGTKRPKYGKVEQVEVLFNYSALVMLEAIRAMNAPEDEKEALIALIGMDAGRTAFEEMRYKHLSSEAWLKDGIESTLPAILLRQGFQICRLEESQLLESEGCAAGEAGRKAVNADNAEKLLTASAADNKAVRRFEELGSLTEMDLYGAIRRQAQESLGKEILTENDARFWTGNGAAKLALFRKVFCMAPSDTAEGKVLNSMSAIVARMTTPGEKWTAADSIRFFDAINTHRSTAIRLGFAVAQAKTDRAKCTAVTKMLSQIGLRTKRRDGGQVVGDYYQVIPETLERMQGYVANTRKI